MAHWGWYWKIKKKHIHRASCSSLATLDSFDFFKEGNRIGFKMAQFQLVAMVSDHCFTITYGRNKNHSYTIPIEKQPCQFGGLRYFFRCPLCAQRMRILYSDKGVFLCRKCLNLGYYTQRLRPSERLLIMASKIEKTLKNKAGDLNKKPLGMWQSTFEALKQRHSQYCGVKYNKAKDKEFLEYYPHLADELMMEL
jgi:hypothetical protein